MQGMRWQFLFAFEGRLGAPLVDGTALVPGRLTGAAQPFRRAAERQGNEEFILQGKEQWIMIRAGLRCSLFQVGLLAAAVTVCVASAAQADLFVSSDTLGTVLQYDENTGAFIQDFLLASGFSGSVGSPRGILFGPDGNLYVASDALNGVLSFDSMGNFLSMFVTSAGELDGPRGIIFGPDGNLYVSSKRTNSVERYDGKSGTYIDDFIPSGTGGLNGPRGLVFGPDGNLYVGSFGDVVAGGTPQVLKYDPSGNFLGVFASDSLSGLNGLTFGPDGSLYVSNGGVSINHYDGTSSQLLGVLDPANNAGLGDPNGILFGPDGNLYVDDLGGAGGVLQYNGTTGDFLAPFIDATTSGDVSYMTFTKTNPTTLTYGP
jgi:streptogramin lyase